MKYFIVILISFFFNSFSQELFKIKVNVKNVEKIEGKIYYAITNQEDVFPDIDKFLKNGTIEVKDNNITFELDNIEKGYYGIIIFQDLNNNSKLDKMWFPPIPKEPYGVSNNVKRMGKPRYNDAKFLVDKNLELDILLNN